jgi:hypothetical protein
MNAPNIIITSAALEYRRHLKLDDWNMNKILETPAFANISRVSNQIKERQCMTLNAMRHEF